MSELEFYIGELENALGPVESQLRLSGRVEVPRLRELITAAQKTIQAFDNQKESTDD